jgi:hypothetical protein
MLTLAAPGVVTDIVMALDISVLGKAQGAVEVIITVTTSLFASVAEVKVELFVPTFALLTLHWYNGVPPFTGTAVNVTEVPAQIAPTGKAVMVTLGVTEGVIDTGIGLDVAGLPVEHAMDEVITTVTTSLFASADDVKFAELVPTFVEFTFH